MAAALIVWRRNAAQLFFSFVTAGLVTVAAQDFFARAAPASKDRWLAATLLVGTLASIAGVAAGRRLTAASHRLRLGVAAALAALAVALVGVAAPLAFAALHVAARGLCNLGVQIFDARAAALAAPAERRANDHAGTSLRFVGMLAGPITFGASAGATASTVASVLGASLFALTSALALRADRRADRRTEPPPPDRAALGRTSAPPDPSASLSTVAPTAPLRPLLAAVLAFYAGNYLLATTLVFLFADAYALAEPVAHAGRVMTVVYAATVVTSLVIAGRGARVRAGWMITSGAALLLTGAGLVTDLARSTALHLGVGAILGASFAVALLAAREAASRAALAGDGAALAAFNNLGNTSALVAFGLLAALVELGRALALPFASTVAGGLVGLALVGLACLAWTLAIGARRR